jgi:hypothetical protein
VEQMRCKDERLKLTNELLMGIRVVKLYAWERPLCDKIAAIRKREASACVCLFFSGYLIPPPRKLRVCYLKIVKKNRNGLFKNLKIKKIPKIGGRVIKKPKVEKHPEIYLT